MCCRHAPNHIQGSTPDSGAGALLLFQATDYSAEGMKALQANNFDSRASNSSAEASASLDASRLRERS